VKGGIVYRLDFASGKSYVGVTIRPLAVRVRAHEKSAQYGSKDAVHCAWRAYGPPSVVTLAIVERHMLVETERGAIEVFGTLTPLGGYNMLPGGDVSVGPQSPASIERMASTKRGRKLSLEHRQNISDGLKRSGRAWVISQEVRDKIATTLRGRKHSVEARANMSASKRGLKRTQEHQAKLAAALRGRVKGPLPAEVVAKREETKRRKKVALGPAGLNYGKPWSRVRAEFRQ
jgi:hypothetical protein